MSELERISREFGEIYKEAAEHDKLKKTKQAELFEAFDEEIRVKQTLKRRSIRIPLNKDAAEYVRVYHPGYKLVSDTPKRTHREKEHSYAVYIIEEDPSFMKWTYINRSDGMVYGRTIRHESPLLDDERLREEDPDLYEAITEWPEPWWSLVLDAIADYHNDYDKAKEHTAKFLEAKGLLRVIKPYDQLTKQQLHRLQPYMVPGKLTVRLQAPREAKPEELE